VNRAQRLLLSGVALTALLAAVAVASRAHRPGGGSGGGSADAGRVAFEYAASVMFVLFPLGALFVLWVLSMGRRQKLLEDTGLRRNVVIVLMVGVLILPVTLLVRHFVKYDGGGPMQPPAPPSTQTDGRVRGADREADPQFQWLPALIVGSLLFGIAGAGAIVIVLKRLRGADWEREAALMHALDEVLEDTLDDLRAERDPRKAVIGAYARMERLFAAHQVPRDEAETPQQYVERVLARLQVSSFAARRLTSLYERARFSPHTVDGAMKDDAIAALEGLRAELNADEAAAA
jgi:Domain of unknown function (DUF4129)